MKVLNHIFFKNILSYLWNKGEDKEEGPPSGQNINTELVVQILPVLAVEWVVKARNAGSVR